MIDGRKMKVFCILFSLLIMTLLSHIVFAAEKEYILIGRPNPTTGPIAAFGEATPWAEQRVIDYVNSQGGIYIKEYGKKLPLKLKVVDTESSPTKAAEVASRLILYDNIDLMVVLHTPDTTVPVAGVCERYGVPNISLDTPVEPWLSGGPYKWSYHAFWTTGQLVSMVERMWSRFKEEGKVKGVVGLVCPDDPDGVIWAQFYKKILPPKGYRIVDVGRFPYGLKDYGAFISTWKKEGVDILAGVVPPPDWATLWRQCHREGYIPKIATIGKALLFPSAVNALGDNLPNGLTTEVWWSPYHPFRSALTGETPREICDAWEKETGKQWTQPTGFKYAGIEIAVDVLKRAGTLDKEALRKAIEETDLDTVVGHIKYNKQHYCQTPLVGGQWVKGEKWSWELAIVHNEELPEVPKTEMFLLE